MLTEERERKKKKQRENETQRLPSDDGHSTVHSALEVLSKHAQASGVVFKLLGPELELQSQPCRIYLP